MCPSFTGKNETQQQDSRAILVASVEDHEGVRLSKEVLFIQFVRTKLHGRVILQTEGKRPFRIHAAECLSVVMHLDTLCAKILKSWSAT